ncbi:MAG: NAD(P)/FAD-dependent oxidoreductase [Elusimicrobiota bacterium]|jgi:glycerol-3-phosphate dehydrogenase|nr:NAD(P)/FAD-dependent oxidoreductase [Elusimicrobiota bacterium]
MDDVIIIGAGVCGCSLAYELSRYQVKTLLLEKENDVSEGTTKANSAIVHAGYDPKPQTKMASYNVEGNAIIEQLSADLDIPYKKIGSLVVGFDETDRKTIEKLLDQGIQNGVKGLRIIEKDELLAMEPNLTKEALCALYAPSAGIIAPWELAIAQAECAVMGGTKIQLNAEVLSIEKIDGGFNVRTTAGDFKARFVVNAAGVNSGTVSRMLEPEFFSIVPKSGEYYLLDTTENGIVNMVIFPCPSDLGKGILVSPTIHDNVIVGPDSKVVDDKDDLGCTSEGLENVRKGALRLVPNVNIRASIRNFSGIRADAQMEDFIVGQSKTVKGFFNMAGIKSPGLTSAPAIAKDIAAELNQAGLEFKPNPNFVSKRRIKRFKHMTEAQKAQAIKENPAYGAIVCRCQTVTEGEILDALNRPVPPVSLDGVKRRTVAGMGRCQGGFCGPRVHSLIAQKLKKNQKDITLDKGGTYIVLGETKRGKI